MKAVREECDGERATTTCYQCSTGRGNSRLRGRFRPAMRSRSPIVNVRGVKTRPARVQMPRIIPPPARTVNKFAHRKMSASGGFIREEVELLE